MEEYMLDHLASWTMSNVIYSHPEYLDEIGKLKTSILLIYGYRLSDKKIDKILRLLIQEMNTRYLEEFGKKLERPIDMNDIRILLTRCSQIYIASIKILIPVLEYENTNRYNAAHALLMLNYQILNFLVKLKINLYLLKLDLLLNQLV